MSATGLIDKKSVCTKKGEAGYLIAECGLWIADFN
jgi:hypothetical protein